MFSEYQEYPAFDPGMKCAGRSGICAEITRTGAEAARIAGDSPMISPAPKTARKKQQKA